MRDTRVDLGTAARDKLPTELLHPVYIILTLGRTVFLFLVNLINKQGATFAISKNLGMSLQRIKPGTRDRFSETGMLSKVDSSRMTANSLFLAYLMKNYK